MRNMKTKVKRDSITTYFHERCGGGPKSKDFWPTIKPFLTQKPTYKTDNPIILKKSDGELLSDQATVANTLNSFYVNIAKNIGIAENEQDTFTHPSTDKINNNCPQSQFTFKLVTEKDKSKSIKRLNPKKGYWRRSNSTKGQTCWQTLPGPSY
jgi:hypothetical protein